MRSVYLATVDSARPLLDHPDLEQRWLQPSVLEKMTIGALTAHLARSVTLVEDYGATVGEPPLRDAPGYFVALMARPDTDPDSDLARSVRSRADAEAEAGLAAVIESWDTARRAVEKLNVTDQQPIKVRGSSMALADYLGTRLVELVIHADDLAASLGSDPPAFPSDATRAVLGCLVEIVSRRSGALPLIRALTRVERGDPTVLRVF